MKRLVVDASVAVKWLLPDRLNESHTDNALLLLEAIQDGRVELLQPPHWLAEVVAVLARLAPEIAERGLRLLQAMDIDVCQDTATYTRGIELAVQVNHHVFDTLYHAVALSGQAEALVTADMRYFRKAAHLGRVSSLAEFMVSSD